MLFVTLCGCDFGHLLSAAPFPVLVRQGRVLMVLLSAEGGRRLQLLQRSCGACLAELTRTWLPVVPASLVWAREVVSDLGVKFQILESRK